MTHPNDAALDVLERRVAALELKILSPQPATSTQSITDQLLQVQVMISSALNCRDTVNNALKQLEVINERLDPLANNIEDVELMKNYILSNQSLIVKVEGLMQTFETHQQFINSDHIQKLPNLSSKLDELYAENLAICEHSREVTKSVLNTLNEYNQILFSMKYLCAQFDGKLNELSA